MWSRIHLIPLLQAEEDRDLVRRHLASQAMEKELLGAETKVYNSDRCVLFGLWKQSSRQKDPSVVTDLSCTDSCDQHLRLHRAM